MKCLRLWFCGCGRSCGCGCRVGCSRKPLIKNFPDNPSSFFKNRPQGGRYLEWCLLIALLKWFFSLCISNSFWKRFIRLWPIDKGKEIHRNNSKNWKLLSFPNFAYMSKIWRLSKKKTKFLEKMKSHFKVPIHQSTPPPKEYNFFLFKIPQLHPFLGRVKIRF